MSFEARAGEIVGVAGLVGSGRTYLARALCGLDPHRGGTVLFDGTPFRPRTPTDALARGFLYVTEDRKRTGLFLDLPAAWNMTLPCLDRLGMGWWVRPRHERELALTAGQLLSLRWPGPEVPVGLLSGGNQQKVLLGRALLADSQCIVLDEPTRGIDIAAKADLYRLLCRLADEGRTLLLISSELPELFGLADRLLVMRRGRVVADLTTAQTSPEEVMRSAAIDGTQ